MTALDASFCFDLLRGDEGARSRGAEWERDTEVLTIPAPALSEFLRAGYRRGGRFLDRSSALAGRLEVLSLERDSAQEADRIGGELDRRGHPMGNLDLLTAAIVRRHGTALVTRDHDFQRIPGHLLEMY